MKSFTFIDLFAGIGGFHLALHSLGGECVFASEIDPHARKTYECNFKKISPSLFEKSMFNDDIRTISPIELPDFDILCGGFPCQPFSQAGKKRGFNDTHKSERGNLFFKIVDIISEKRPKAFFLENVRGILNHDHGRTFSTIRKMLEDELGYSFYFKVVNALDYGLPQLRPRVFMIGFRDEHGLKSFSFPNKEPLKFNMSDVWGGECSREIGFTIRVGGRGSNIDDRRNWDSYLVDGTVKKLMPEQARKMQGFPDDFEFPVTPTQAMRQLGNSVAVDAIKACAKSMLDYLSTLSSNNELDTKNKGEWTELYSLMKCINDKVLYLADENTNPTDELLILKKVSTLNLNNEFIIRENDVVRVASKTTGEFYDITVSEFLNDNTLNAIVGEIKRGQGSFSIPSFQYIQKPLGIANVKGGNSNQKSDIILDIKNNYFDLKNEGFGIKSYLGSSPTLLNASKNNTNFTYEVIGLSSKNIDQVNSIDTKTKIIDRIKEIKILGGTLKFSRIEADAMAYNLSMVDSVIPDLIAEMLLEFYTKRTNKISENLRSIIAAGKVSYITHGDFNSLSIKVKRLLVSVLLGFFSGRRWNGNYISNGVVIVKDSGDQVGFHISRIMDLENYLFNHVKFDTPSTTRHRFGSLILENDGRIYFKLNLQLRF